MARNPAFWILLIIVVIAVASFLLVRMANRRNGTRRESHLSPGDRSNSPTQPPGE